MLTFYKKGFIYKVVFNGISEEIRIKLKRQTVVLIVGFYLFAINYFKQVKTDWERTQ
jgi:hypothetical protein